MKIQDVTNIRIILLNHGFIESKDKYLKCDDIRIDIDYMGETITIWYYDYTIGSDVAIPIWGGLSPIELKSLLYYCSLKEAQIKFQTLIKNTPIKIGEYLLSKSTEDDELTEYIAAFKSFRYIQEYSTDQKVSTNSIKERIQILARNAGLSERQFSLSIGKSESFIRTIKENVGSDTIRNILIAYPDVNPYWLLLGTGDMFIKDKEASTIKQDTQLYIESLKEQVVQLKEIIRTKDEIVELLKKEK